MCVCVFQKYATIVTVLVLVECKITMWQQYQNVVFDDDKLDSLMATSRTVRWRQAGQIDGYKVDSLMTSWTV